MTLDEDNIPVDEEATQSFRRDDSAAWQEGLITIPCDNVQETPVDTPPMTKFRLDEAYASLLLKYACSSARVHLPGIYVNYNYCRR